MCKIKKFCEESQLNLWKKTLKQICNKKARVENKKQTTQRPLIHFLKPTTATTKILYFYRFFHNNIINKSKRISGKYRRFCYFVIECALKHTRALH